MSGLGSNPGFMSNKPTYLLDYGDFIELLKNERKIKMFYLWMAKTKVTHLHSFSNIFLIINGIFFVFQNSSASTSH